MSSFDKVVKLACKPKAAPPKAKYIDPIIAATWSDDGAVHDVCKALVPRIREPNSIVVFKALIVLHTMMRNGATDNVLSYLSQANILRLRNISATNWEGYSAPQNLQNYALYLESRIVAYRELKHDAVKVQAESNRDMRNSHSIEEEGAYRGRKDRKQQQEAAPPTRSKTIMGRKLRSMTVEKGLLRETKAVHKMIDALVECRFYLDDLEDELTITALRMLVKDLLILFQAGNEGVINVLENYFEMSHVDAEQALSLYRHFCSQTENVVEFLGVAKKLQNLLNVPIPNLKHAPVSLAGALQEYLDDANFEQNRIEYKMNKQAAERGTKTNGTKSASGKSSGAKSPPVPSPSPSQTASSNAGQGSSTGTSTAAQDGKSKEVLDFFSAIEEEQPTMFNPQTNSPSTAYFQQQGAVNPFSQMMTGQPFAQPQMGMQQTGFLIPQATAVPAAPNPFGNFLSAQPTGHRPFSSYLPQQATGFPQQMQPTGLAVPQGFLQPQTTGANPFRQSMLVPQTTGMQLFGVANQPSMPGPGFPQSQTMMNLGQTPNPNANTNGASQFSQGPGSANSIATPRPSFGPTSPMNSNAPARPASTPLTSTTAGSAALQPVKTHQTGTKNPFGPVTTAAPPVPKAPTLFELTTGAFNQNQNQNQANQAQGLQQQQAQQQQPQQTGMNGFNFGNSALNPGKTDISSVASSFAFSNNKPNFSGGSNPLVSQNTAATNTTATTGTDSLFGSSLSSQPTGATSTSFSPQISSASSLPGVKSHTTGMGNLKAFKPTSSFGASLLESLPPIPGSAPNTPAVTGGPSNNNGTNAFSNFSTNGAFSTNGTAPSSTTPSNASSPPSIAASNNTSTQSAFSSSSNLGFLNSQPTGIKGAFVPQSQFGSTLGVGLRPQMTGGGSANPFRASMAGTPNFTGGGGMQAVPPMPTGMGGSQQQPFTAGGAFGGTGAFGSSAFGIPNQQGGGQQQQQQQQQQQTNGMTSLI